MKKTLLVTLSFMSFYSTPAAAEVCRARLMFNNASQTDVIVLAYDNGAVSYKLNPQDRKPKKIRSPKLESIYFYQPAIYREAMALYHGRKYKQAKGKFAQCQAMFSSVNKAPNNYATLAGFYKMECSRRMFEYENLSREMKEFDKTGLMRETHLQQLEVNVFFEAVRLKDWDRVNRLAKAWEKRKVTGHQRAQISYCHGLALKELAKNDSNFFEQALNAFNFALTADFTHSIEIVTASAAEALDMYEADPDVQQAMKVWNTEAENRGSRGYQLLLEAHGLAQLYKQAGFHKHKPLGDMYETFLKYAPGAGSQQK